MVVVPFDSYLLIRSVSSETVDNVTRSAASTVIGLIFHTGVIPTQHQLEFVTIKKLIESGIDGLLQPDAIAKQYDDRI